MWLSVDPALGEYLPEAPVDDEARERNGKLPGMGGVFNTVNLHLYHYAGNNPVKYTDPDGMKLKSSFQLFQVPETGNKKLDAANKIVFGIAKILLGDLITKGGIGGGAAIAGGTSGAGTVVGAGVAIAGVAIGSAVTADGLVNIAEGTLSLMQSNRNKSSNKEETASEQMAISMRRQIERDLGQNAGRDFHEMKDGPDRMPQQLKEDVAAIYEDYGKGELLPKWMTPE